MSTTASTQKSNKKQKKNKSAQDAQAGATPTPEHADASANAAHGTAASASDGVSRLPPVGTLIEKKVKVDDGNGGVVDKVVASCRVMEHGQIMFPADDGIIYGSISAVAVVAAEKLGSTVKALNGYKWWGLETAPKKEKREANTAQSHTIASRFESRVAALVEITPEALETPGEANRNAVGAKLTQLITDLTNIAKDHGVTL